MHQCKRINLVEKEGKYRERVKKYHKHEGINYAVVGLNRVFVVISGRGKSRRDLDIFTKFFNIAQKQTRRYNYITFAICQMRIIILFYILIISHR